VEGLFYSPATVLCGRLVLLLGYGVVWKACSTPRLRCCVEGLFNSRAPISLKRAFV